MTEIVYLLTNPTMPNLVKIGRTGNLEERIKSLSTHSGVPVPFECFYACEVADGIKVERALHEAFGDHRINSKREFFRLNPDRAQVILELLSLKNLTPTSDIVDDVAELEALQREQLRRSNFKFSMAGVPIGAILTFVKDEKITAKVFDERQIEFEGEITSTSAAARTLLHRMGGKLTAAQGPLYWEYEGETLSERRFNLEDSST